MLNKCGVALVLVLLDIKEGGNLMDLETKFHVGDKVWVMESNRPVEKRVRGMEISHRKGWYKGCWNTKDERAVILNIELLGKEDYVSENSVFASKDDLIEYLRNLECPRLL